MIVDVTAEMVHIGLAAVAVMIVSVMAIGASADRSEREAMRVLAERIGAWWAQRSSSRATVPHRAIDIRGEKRQVA